MTRNSHLGSGWKDGDHNMVFSGCTNAPATHCGNGDGGNPYTNINASPVIAEKPYISENNGRWTLNIPKVEHNKVGATMNNFVNSDQVDFSRVFVANEQNTASEINTKLDQGLHIVL